MTQSKGQRRQLEPGISLVERPGQRRRSSLAPEARRRSLNGTPPLVSARTRWEPAFHQCPRDDSFPRRELANVAQQHIGDLDGCLHKALLYGASDEGTYKHQPSL